VESSITAVLEEYTLEYVIRYLNISVRNDDVQLEIRMNFVVVKLNRLLRSGVVYILTREMGLCSNPFSDPIKYFRKLGHF